MLIFFGLRLETTLVIKDPSLCIYYTTKSFSAPLFPQTKRGLLSGLIAAARRENRPGTVSPQTREKIKNSPPSKKFLLREMSVVASCSVGVLIKKAGERN